MALSFQIYFKQPFIFVWYLFILHYLISLNYIHQLIPVTLQSIIPFLSSNHLSPQLLSTLFTYINIINASLIFYHPIFHYILTQQSNFQQIIYYITLYLNKFITIHIIIMHQPLKLNPISIQHKTQAKINNNSEQQNLLSLLSSPPLVFLKKPPLNPPSHHIYLTQQTVPIQLKKIIMQVEKEMDKGDIVEATQLLRKGKQIAKHSKDKLRNSVIYVNLAICYYKIGLLEQSFQQLWLSQIGFKEAANLKKITIPINLNGLNSDYYTSLSHRIKLKRLRGKITLQICILCSQLGNHELAMKYSKTGCRIHYNLIYDILIILYGIIIKYLSDGKYVNSGNRVEQQQIDSNERVIELPQQFNRIVNLIGILNHLIQLTKDVKIELLSKYKQNIIAIQLQYINKFGKIKNQVDLDSFMNQINNTQWIQKNKILNQVQMESVKTEDYIENLTLSIQNNQVLQSITYLAVSFYCLSTEVRFLEKNNLKKNNFTQILDSQHWLSKSLQLAYTFLPSQAPILGQIYSVHNKFHGIDKQAIPQDKQMQGYVKILKPLRRPKSTYTKSSLCVPILIRIQTPKTLASEETKVQTTFYVKKPIIGNSYTIQMQTNLKKNNNLNGTKNKNLGVPKKLQFLNSLQKIYKNQLNKPLIPKLETPVKKQASLSLQKRKFTPIEHSRQSSVEVPKRPLSNQHFKIMKRNKQLQSQTIDIMQNVQQNEFRQKKIISNGKKKNVDIQINNNINLFITNQIGRVDEGSMTIQYNNKDEKLGIKQGGNKKMILKLIQGNPNKKDISKRSLYYGKKKGSNALVQETTTFLPQF